MNMQNMNFLLWENDIPGYMPDDAAVYAKLDAMACEQDASWRMGAKKELWDNYIMKPAIRTFTLNGKNNPAMLVVPGGAYIYRSDENEGTPIAKWLNGLGISAFILDYRVAPYEYPIPLLDAKRAMRLIRANADHFGIDPKRFGVIGFSAGGHLASTLSTIFDIGKPSSQDPIERQSCRPDLSVLCYPVITMGALTHKLSRIYLIGEAASEELTDLTSSEKQVIKDTPPTFIWHTQTDDAVPVENTLLYANALKNANIPYATHIFPDGGHGLGLATEYEGGAHSWPNLFAKWINGQWGLGL